MFKSCRYISQKVSKFNIWKTNFGRSTSSTTRRYEVCLFIGNDQCKVLGVTSKNLGDVSIIKEKYVNA